MRIIVLFIFVVFASCTSTLPLSDPTLTRENLSAHLNVEDRIKINKKDGESLVLIIDSIEETYLLGHNNQADILIIPYSSIEKIEAYHFSHNKTIGLAIPVVLLLTLFIIVGIQGGAAL